MTRSGIYVDYLYLLRYSKIVKSYRMDNKLFTTVGWDLIFGKTSLNNTGPFCGIAVRYKIAKQIFEKIEH